MVVGVCGTVVPKLVVLEFRQEHARTQHQHMEDLGVEDLQDESATHVHVRVINLVLLY